MKTTNPKMDHTPVLKKQVLEFLQIKEGGTYVDCTLGSGGHAKEILSQLRGRGQLLAFDRDQETLEQTRQRLATTFENFQTFHENYTNLPIVLRHLEIPQLDGCLLDLGVSSIQLDSPDRGFSFRLEGPLDMRMDIQQKTTAADLVNDLLEDDLIEIFRKYGEEKSARKIAAAIVEHREKSRFQTTTDLADLIARVKGSGSGRLHPATQVFQALRIEVNQELTNLDKFLKEAIDLLAPGGRLAVISFHSLEDRVVKRTFRMESGKCICFRPRELCTCDKRQEVKILTKKPVQPTENEVFKNRRARSAKLRVVEKKGTQKSSGKNSNFSAETLGPEDGWNASSQVQLDPKQRFEATRIELNSWIHSRLTRYELRPRIANKGVTPWSTFFSNN